jgi:hypothetical protein
MFGPIIRNFPSINRNAIQLGHQEKLLHPDNDGDFSITSTGRKIDDFSMEKRAFIKMQGNRKQNVKRSSYTIRTSLN